MVFLTTVFCFNRKDGKPSFPYSARIHGLCVEHKCGDYHNNNKMVQKNKIVHYSKKIQMNRVQTFNIPYFTFSRYRTKG